MKIKEILKSVADKMTDIKNEGIEEVCPIGIIDIDKWEWPQGVGMYGLYRYYKKTNDEKYLKYLTNWYDKRINEGLPEKNINTMAPMLTLAFLYEETNNKKYFDICDEWASYAMTKLPRTKDGGLQHIVTGELNEGQLWDDTLFMTVLFLAKMGMLLNNKEYIDETVKQFLVHIKYLYDKETGLWFHGFDFNGNHNFAKALWARGNSWITAGIPDYLEITEIQGSIKEYLIDTLKAQIEALIKYQAQDGMWHTLINDQLSYKETSATAGFAYGILRAIKLGYINEAFTENVDKALDAVLKRIDNDGTVLDVSYGTGMGRDLDHYRNIPLCPMTYGQALVILLLAELI